MKENLGMCVEYKMSLRSVLQSKLNRGKMVKVINTYVVSVLSYNKDIVKRSIEQLENLNRVIRKQLTLYKVLHSKSDVDMVYADRKAGKFGGSSQTGRETVMWKTLSNL